MAARRTLLVGLVILAIWMLSVYRGSVFVSRLTEQEDAAGCGTGTIRLVYLERRVRTLREEVDRLKNEQASCTPQRHRSPTPELKPTSTSSRKLEANSNSNRRRDEAQDSIAKRAIPSTRRLADAKSDISKKFDVIALRRLETTVVNWWKTIQYETSRADEKTTKTKKFVDISADHLRNVLIDVARLRNASRLEQRTEVETATSAVQERFRLRQNPPSCGKDVKRLVCSVNKMCGFGCQVHHVAYCFLLAHGLGRVFVLASDMWSYNRGGRGWSDVFEPVSSSSCEIKFADYRSLPAYNPKTYDPDAPVVRAHFIDNYVKNNPPYLPFVIPTDLVNVVQQFHRIPGLWFLGQIVAYLLRLNGDMQKFIDDLKTSIGFKKPIVGVHVRRTDKLMVEAQRHSIEEYMRSVDDYYQVLETRPIAQKRVFVATDDVRVIHETKEKYRDYALVFNEVAATKARQQRYTLDSLKGIISDIILLSETDYLVCTFSSQVCRLAYELMQTKHVDASDRYHSLDDVYYFGGSRRRQWRAIYPHAPREGATGELEIEVGDVLGVEAVLGGYYVGKNERTGKKGQFPVYKVEEIADVKDFF